MRVGWGAVMMEVGRGWAESPKRQRGDEDEGRASRVPPTRALPEKAGHSSPFKGRGCLQMGRREILWPPEKPPFLLGCRISPGWRVSGEKQGGVLRPAGRSAANAQKSPHCGRCPVSQAAEVGKGAPRPNPQLSAPRNSHPERLCASAPVINYRTQGGICKPHITNSTGLK